MIRESQTLLNRLNVLSDMFIIYGMLPVAYWLRFYIMSGVENVPLMSYLRLGVVITLCQLFTLAACLLNMLLLMSWLYLRHELHYSRWLLALYYLLSAGTLVAKRIFVRISLGVLRSKGRNLKHVLLIGSGPSARRYFDAVCAERQLG